MGKFICVIDYGSGNLKSVRKALEFVGMKVKISDKAEDLKSASAIVLPGVGAFRQAMNSLQALGILPVMLNEIKKGKPFLGICLGLQLLFTESEEHGICKGLSLIKGRVKKFGPGVKIPHMGWNQIKIKNQKIPAGRQAGKIEIFKEIPDNSYFYFVHSYYVQPENKNVIVATTDYGKEFVSAINKDNIWAVQFHPEKSSKQGLKFLENFCRYAS